MRRALVSTLAALLAAGTVGGVAHADGDRSAGSRVVRLSGPTPFPAGCDGVSSPDTLYPNAEVQPHLAVDPSDPRHLVGVWQQDRFSAVAAHGLRTATSFDGGAHWSSATPAFSRCAGGEFPRATDSSVAVAPDGTAYVASLSMGGSVVGDHAIQLSRSRTGGRTWEAPTTLVREGTAPGGFVFNDLPWVTADPTATANAYVVWDRIVDPPLGGPLYFTRTTDRGSTFSTPRPILDPGTNAVASGGKIVVQPDGALVALVAVTRYDADEQPVGRSFQSTRSTDKGGTWSAPVTVAETSKVGTTEPVSGRSVRDGSDFAGQLAVGPRGELFVVWQDSRFSGGVRDGIALARSGDSGRTWSAPSRVNPEADRQAFSPAVAVTADGTVGVTYSLQGKGSTAEYRIAQSRDGGRGWVGQRVGGPFDLAVAPVVDSPPNSLYLGDYHGMVAAGLRFVSVFPRTTPAADNRTDIYASFTPARR